MRARIASEPIRTALAGTEYRGRQSEAATRTEEEGTEQPPSELLLEAPNIEEASLPAVSVAPDAFAASALSAQLVPVPQSRREVILRFTGSWAPPDSGLRLTDRKV